MRFNDGFVFLKVIPCWALLTYPPNCHDFLGTGEWQRMVLEELEHTLLGDWINFGIHAWRGRFSSHKLCMISLTKLFKDEKRFLVTVIKDLLGLCEQKKGKDNKVKIQKKCFSKNNLWFPPRQSSRPTSCTSWGNTQGSWGRTGGSSRQLWTSSLSSCTKHTREFRWAQNNQEKKQIIPGDNFFLEVSDLKTIDVNHIAGYGMWHFHQDCPQMQKTIRPGSGNLVNIFNTCSRPGFYCPLQVGEVMPFIDELLGGINSIICDLQPQQVQTFYEAVGHMISARWLHWDFTKLQFTFVNENLVQHGPAATGDVDREVHAVA